MKALNWANVALGVWLLMAPFALSYERIQAALWEDVVVGLLIAAYSLWRALEIEQMTVGNWIVALEKITKDMPRDTIYIAGHARQGQAVTTDRAAVLRLRDYFDALLAFTQKAIAAGTSREALAKTETLPGFESFQAAPPALTLGGALGVAYDELTAKG